MKKAMKRLTSVLLCLVVLLSLSVPALAAERKTGYVGDAKDVMTYINQYRTNPATAKHLELNWTTTELDLKPLKWDEDLAHIARTRAKEVSQNYSHTRPDGSTYWDLTYNGKEVYTEIVCRDVETAKEAVDYWYAPDSETYAYQNNRRDMLSPKVHRMGAAHYYSAEKEQDYWVVSFGL